MEHTLLFDLELKNRVTRRQVNFVGDARIPTRDEQPPRVWVTFDLFDESCDLIDAVARRIMPAERAPEITIDGAEITRRAPEPARVFEVGPLLPDVHAARAQVALVRAAGQEPK